MAFAPIFQGRENAHGSYREEKQDELDRIDPQLSYVLS